jgi:sugar fermentation stimulation protein A
MKFNQTLIFGKLQKRYKRFLADIELENGDIVTAHCPNPGSMIGLKEPGSEVWLYSLPEGGGRKLNYRWELVKFKENLVGINTGHPNKLVEHAIRAQKIPELTGYKTIRREVSYGNNSRVDLLLEDPNRSPCYVEVKNVNLRRGDLAEFPDSVTARGAKHLNELKRMVEKGARAVIFYVVQRDDCQAFAIAKDIDPNYAKTASSVYLFGVEPLCYSCVVTTTGIEIDKPMKIIERS